MCLRNRIQAHDTDLLTHAVTVLTTNGWERSESASFGHAAFEAVCQRFQVPLEAASLDISAVQEEWDDMVDYGRKYLNLVQEDYKVLWWKLYNAVDSGQWRNILGVVELLCTCLGEDTLDRLIRINVEGPPLSKWNANGALELWQKDKVRRVNRKDTQNQSGQGSTSTPSTSTSASTCTDSNESHIHFSLDDWEEWIASS